MKIYPRSLRYSSWTISIWATTLVELAAEERDFLGWGNLIQSMKKNESRESRRNFWWGILQKGELSILVDEWHILGFVLRHRIPLFSEKDTISELLPFSYQS